MFDALRPEELSIYASLATSTVLLLSFWLLHYNAKLNKETDEAYIASLQERVEGLKALNEELRQVIKQQIHVAECVVQGKPLPNPSPERKGPDLSKN